MLGCRPSELRRTVSYRAVLGPELGAAAAPHAAAFAVAVASGGGGGGANTRCASVAIACPQPDRRRLAKPLAAVRVPVREGGRVEGSCFPYTRRCAACALCSLAQWPIHPLDLEPGSFALPPLYNNYNNYKNNIALAGAAAVPHAPMLCLGSVGFRQLLQL